MTEHEKIINRVTDERENFISLLRDIRRELPFWKRRLKNRIDLNLRDVAFDEPTQKIISEIKERSYDEIMEALEEIKKQYALS